MHRLVALVIFASVYVHAQMTDELNQQLPRWLQFSGEYRVRIEGFSALRYRPGADDHYWLNRARLNVKFQPLSWLKFVGQAQDSRIFGNRLVASGPPFQDTLDLRLGFAEIGNSDSGAVGLRVGRQEIDIGEQRILGSSNWGNTARSFDAVRLTLRRKSVRFDAFASSVVAQADDVFDRHIDGDVLHGAMALIQQGRHRVEPYFLWRLAPRVRTETGPMGKLSSGTLGFLWTTKLSPRVTAHTEINAQTGSWGSDSIGAWAGLWRFVVPTGRSRWAPSLRLEYNYATGDKDPTDGRHGTFELLYPTPHDKYGLADQVGWKNIHHIGPIAEWKLPRNWVFQTKYHTWWLASATDGVYTAGGVLIARDATGRSGRHIGHEMDFQALGQAGKRVLIGGGIGHIFPGEFLRNTTPGAHYTFPYVMVTWSF